jgi:osmotically-inducible protein OsmY
MQPPASTDRSAGDANKHGALGHLSDDEALQQAVCEALIADGELDSSDIGVRVSHDTVVLSGSVQTRQQWLRAVEVAKAQEGVAKVQVDALNVRGA